MTGAAEAVGEELPGRLGLTEPVVPPVVLGADSGSASGEAVIRRAAEIAREQDAQLVVVRVRITDGLARCPSADQVNRHRKLTVELGGTYIQAQGPTLREALANTARAQDAAIIVVGRHQSRLAEFFLGSMSARLRRFLPGSRCPGSANVQTSARPAPRRIGEAPLLLPTGARSVSTYEVAAA